MSMRAGTGGMPARETPSGGCDVGRLQTLGPFRHFKFYSGALIQAAISLRLNRRKMNEDVLSVLALDEAVALGCVKPLHCTFFFHLPYVPSVRSQKHLTKGPH